MNITYILGNGFDLNIGLKTHYSDFYDYYVKVPSDDEDIKKFKKDIKGNNRYNWSDLESALGKYTKEISDVDVMCKILEDINNNLKDYIKGVEKSFIGNDDNIKTTLLNDLKTPEQFLLSKYKQNFLNFYNSRVESNAVINIISLNYTSTVEKMIIDHIPINNGLGFPNKYVSIEKIYHLHHTISDETIILGVADEKQIENDSFKTDIRIKEYLIKSETNKMLGTRIDDICSGIIASTNVFVIYGVSLGETDNVLWNKIADSMNKNDTSMLIIFERNDKFRGGLRLGSEERFVKEKFLKQVSEDLQNESISNKITVSINSNIFHGLKQYIKIKSFRKGTFSFNYSKNNGEYNIGDGIKSFSTKWSKGSDTIIHAYDDSVNIECIGLIKKLDNFDDITFSNIDYSSRARDAQVGDAIVWKNKKGFYAVTKVISIKDSLRNDETDELTCEYALY